MERPARFRFIVRVTVIILSSVIYHYTMFYVKRNHVGPSYALPRPIRRICIEFLLFSFFFSLFHGGGVEKINYLYKYEYYDAGYRSGDK